MRTILTNVFVVMMCWTSVGAARAETGLYLGTGVRWSEADDTMTMLLRGSLDVAPMLSLGVDLHGLCTGGHELAMDFGGGAVGLFVSPPIGGGLELELGVEAGLMPLTLERHGRDELAPYVAAEIAAALALGSGLALRLSYDHTLTSGYARLGVESQLLLAIGVRL